MNEEKITTSANKKLSPEEMQATGLMEHAGWQKQMMIILG